MRGQQKNLPMRGRSRSRRSESATKGTLRGRKSSSLSVSGVSLRAAPAWAIEDEETCGGGEGIRKGSDGVEMGVISGSGLRLGRRALRLIG